MKITGEMIITKGGSKRPQKIQTETYEEFQLLVDTWECIN